MRFIPFFLSFIVVLSCNTKGVSDINVEEDRTIGVLERENINFIYGPGELIPYTLIERIQCSDTVYGEYDSLALYYDIKIDNPFRDKRHDSLLLNRLTVPTYYDSNFWDVAELFGKKKHKTHWEFLCSLNANPDDISDPKDYSLFMSLLNDVWMEAESRYYYIDDDEWQRDSSIYINFSQYDIRGICRAR